MTPVVYTKPRCVQCDATKVSLKRLGIDFELADLTDSENFEKVTALGYRQAPVVFVSDDLHWSGFDPDKIAALKK